MAKVSLAFRTGLKSMRTRSFLLKHVSANMVSGLGLACSPIVYLAISEKIISASIILLFLVMLLDTLDGIVARAKDRKSSEDGWIVDVSVDRVSEAIISLALSRIFILLTILNMGLALLSYRYRKHVIIPLRQAILVTLLAYFLLESQPTFSFLDQILFDL